MITPHHFHPTNGDPRILSRSDFMRMLQIFIYVIGLIVIMGCNTSAGVTKKTDSFNEKYPKKENNSLSINTGSEIKTSANCLDFLSHALRKSLSQKDWTEASKNLLLLHQQQIISIHNAATTNKDILQATIRSIYNYEIDFIIPLLQKYPSSDVKFNLNDIASFMQRKLSDELSIENFNLIQNMYAFFSCIQKYCLFVNRYDKHPHKLSDFWSHSNEYPAISIQDGQIIWNTHVFFIAVSPQIPSKLTDILNKKIISKSLLKNIDFNSSELGLNNITSEELNYILRFFPKLEQLFIENSSLDFSVITLPETLYTLLITGTIIENFECYQGDNLNYLSLSRCVLKNKTSISRFKKLNTLILNYTNIDNVSGLEELTELRRFEAQNTKFNHLGKISKARLLKVLILKNTHLNELKHINYFHDLEHLDVSHCKIKSLGSLASLNQLKYLNLMNTNIPQTETIRFKKEHPNIIILYTH